VGSPDTVAAKMGEFMQEVGGDGYLCYVGVTRRDIAEVVDGLGSALRPRKLIRDGYRYDNFRDNLMEF
jgi:alkanesulfonate monooxygenase SsuD/methylene tetrahydromethanopterin reductase-like flavin-dependent oxidoreductase (luciferase family)